MKRFPLRVAALAFLLFSLACGDDDDNPSGPSGGDPVGKGPLTAEINQMSYVAEFATVNNVAGQVYVNAAGSSPNWAVGFTFPSAEGTYTFGPGSPVSAGVTIGSANWVGGGANGSGSIVVTVFEEHRVAGTFDFTVIGASPKELPVTDGAFDIEY